MDYFKFGFYILVQVENRKTNNIHHNIFNPPPFFWVEKLFFLEIEKKQIIQPNMKTLHSVQLTSTITRTN